MRASARPRFTNAGHRVRRRLPAGSVVRSGTPPWSVAMSGRSIGCGWRMKLNLIVPSATTLNVFGSSCTFVNR